MMGAYIFLTIFVVTIDLGLFSPTPIDDLTINLNLNESPKGYEEDVFNNNDYHPPYDYTPTIMNYFVRTISFCTVMLEDGKTLRSNALRRNSKWISPKPVDKATKHVLCKLEDGEECDPFYDYGTTDADWVVMGGSGQRPCKVEKKLTEYYPTITNRYIEDIGCVIKLKGGQVMESTSIEPYDKWLSLRPAKRATTSVLCIKGGHAECNNWIDFDGTTNPDWVVGPTGESCEVNEAPILYKPTIRNRYVQNVSCQVTLKGGNILQSTPLLPNRDWMPNEPVNEFITRVECTFGDNRCENFRDDRGTKHMLWTIIENYISKPCKIVAYIL